MYLLIVIKKKLWKLKYTKIRVNSTIDMFLFRCWRTSLFWPSQYMRAKEQKKAFHAKLLSCFCIQFIFCAYTLHADLVMSFSARWCRCIVCAVFKWVGIDIYFENKLNFLLLFLFLLQSNRNAVLSFSSSQKASSSRQD